MDVVAITAMKEIDKALGIKEFLDLDDDSFVIAGGCVRDHFLEGEFKDIDIFFSLNGRTIREFHNHISRNWEALYVDRKIVYCHRSNSDIRDLRHKDNPYNNLTPSNSSFQSFLTEMTFLGKNKIQLIATTLPKKDFASNLVKDFDYNINKAWFDGEQIVTTEEFDNDIRNSTATLAKCKSPQHLFGHIEKFKRLQERYPQLMFDTTLRIEENKETNIDTD